MMCLASRRMIVEVSPRDWMKRIASLIVLQMASSGKIDEKRFKLYR